MLSGMDCCSRVFVLAGKDVWSKGSCGGAGGLERGQRQSARDQQVRALVVYLAINVPPRFEEPQSAFPVSVILAGRQHTRWTAGRDSQTSLLPPPPLGLLSPILSARSTIPKRLQGFLSVSCLLHNTY